MAIAVAQTKTFQVSGEDSTFTVTPDSSVASGSTLILIGSAIKWDTSQTVLLSSVADTSTNTWGTPTNVRSSGSYAPNCFVAIAENVAAGTPTITLTMNQSSSVNVSGALIVVTGPVTSSGVDKTMTGTGPSPTNTVTSTASSGTLTQANNLLVGCVGGFFGIPTAPAGYISVLNHQNGLNGYIGASIAYKAVATTDAVTFTVNHEDKGGASTSAIAVVIMEASVAALRYKFQFDTDTFTSADTGITGYVWRNSGPDGVFAEKYESLAGDATAGNLYITDIPVDVALTDTITGVFFNSNDTSGVVSGTVEQVP